METICIRAKIKAGMLEETRKWFKTLIERSDETLQTLENEGVIVESVFLDKFGDDFYLIYYMKAENLEHAREVSKNSILSIDKYHKECRKNCCEGAQVLELLMDFNRI